ncbi:tRNA (cytidine(34)-2'-O)-methyltransferase [Devosia sp. FJ2-5-3]|jgi:tRNA (cytidine/uridine-2'-O-)-methyltransferase|uniref:tRNA (cytidine(34)-2'-O)-methyltransferase n=1 Tax=Devosia sp. FJ2-5-3 TaxID=2976680 RepID=UPI0023D82EFE|nr:tRNA (cytidine(34)-2'-O)-methyltransferase [Devosia sp. FJ2-5-3]WEJ59549.1 tRNA (cytidine(34)-2'-O)-methyltransferase [Devosia sp. FJ2-5-3]
MDLDIALYQPDIANNTGTLIRLAACMGLTLHIIHPAGFPISPKILARAGLDYVEHAAIREHVNFASFHLWRTTQSRRLVLLTTKSAHSAYDVRYAPGDILMLGRESAGVPDAVAETTELRVRIPMLPERRSLNVALAGAMIVGEAMRQIDGFTSLS